MASTYAELYSDYVQQVKIYTEKLDFTERQFMRDITRGMQLFQRETLIVEKFVQLTPNIDTFYYLPDDCLVVNQIQDINNKAMVAQSYKQWERNFELLGLGHIETTADFSTRLVIPNRSVLMTDALDYYDRVFALPIESTDYSGFWSVFQKRLYFYPDDTYDTTRLKYIRYYPNVAVYSSNETAWTSWFPAQTNFRKMFTSTGVGYPFAPYEYALLNFAISEYVKSQGSINWKVYYEKFMQEIEQCKLDKPINFTEGVLEYNMAPYS